LCSHVLPIASKLLQLSETRSEQFVGMLHHHPGQGSS